jgi:hypothetical protein
MRSGSGETVSASGRMHVPSHTPLDRVKIASVAQMGGCDTQRGRPWVLLIRHVADGFQQIELGFAADDGGVTPS